MRPTLLVRWGLRHHLHHPLRTALAVLGIALGVALFVGIQSALGSATSAFAQAAGLLAGKATHRLLAGPDGVPTGALAAIDRSTAVLAAAPVTEGQARAESPRTQFRHRVRWFGCDPLVEPEVRQWVVGVGGGQGVADAGLPAVAAIALLTRAGAFVASAPTLARLATRPGEDLTLWIDGHRQSAHCVGELPADPAWQRGLDDVLVVDIATAQRWSGRPERVDRVDLVLADGGAELLQAALAEPLRVEPQAGQQAFAELTAAFRTNLQALGLMALLVGAFLVHGAIRGGVAARTVEFALLRALGTSSRRIAGTVALEAMWLGLLGSAIGCGLGVGAAQLLVGPLVRTLNDHYAAFSLHGVTLDPWLIAGALVLGTAVAVAVAAAAWPAHEASTAPPRAVFTSARLPQRRSAAARWLPLPLAIAGLLALLGAGRTVAMAHFGILLLLLAVAVLTPWAIEAALHGSARVARRLGPWLAYVARSAAGSRHRTGSATAALVLAVAITTGLGMMIASFRGSVAGWLDDALPADVYVGVPGRFTERQGAVIDGAIAAAVREVPGVAAASTYRRCQLDVEVGTAAPRAIDVLVLDATPRVLAGLPLLGDVGAARARFGRGEGALASEPLAWQLGLQPGDPVRLFTDGGPRLVVVVGIVRDYRNARGELTLPQSWYGGTAVSALALECEPGTDPEELVKRVRRTLAPFDQSLDVDSQQFIERSSLGVFDRTFAITAALRLLCVGVAVLGIYGAFSALQHERLAEVAVLRALGAGPRHVALLVLGQTTLLGAWAGLLSLPVGYGLGHALVHSINRASFGWTLLVVELPPRLAVEAVAMAVLAAVAAGIEPSSRMVRMAPAVALRED